MEEKPTVVYIYVYLGRARSTDDAFRVCESFGHSLALLQQPGYRRGECAVDTADNRRVFIHEHGGSIEALDAWLASDEHHRLLAAATTLLEAPFETTCTTFWPAGRAERTARQRRCYSGASSTPLVSGG